MANLQRSTQGSIAHMKTAYITHADCLRHEMGAGHPECPDRLNAVNAEMSSSGLLQELRCLEAPLAGDEVMAGGAENAFCDVRPCGQHATQVRSMGFCIFNNIGVAAAYALEKKGLERVAVIDFDVHPGNGTG